MPHFRDSLARRRQGPALALCALFAFTTMTAGWAMARDAEAGAAGIEQPLPERLAFEMKRAGSPLGTHEVTFEQQGQDLIVNVAIDMKVRVLFVTAFKYKHRNREVWRDGRLVSLSATTNDNGKSYWVEAVARDDGLHVDGSAGSYVAPADTMPSSYWHYGTTKVDQLLNTQKGMIEDVEMTLVETVQRTIDGVEVDAERWRLKGSITADVWYDAATGNWLDLGFEARGEEVAYQLKAVPRVVARTETSDSP